MLFFPSIGHIAKDQAEGMQENVKMQVEALPIQSYTSADPLLYANLSIAHPPPTSALLAFSSYSPHPVSTLAFPASSDQLNKFVNLHRFPTLVKLTASNYNDVMKSPTRALVVLAALSKGNEEAEHEKFKSIARAWKRGGRDFSQPVWFVYIEGAKWGGWLRQSYGIKKSQLPAVVVIDPPLSEYYDMTIEGLRVELEGNSVFSVLEGVYNHFLRAKQSESALEWGSRSATMTLILTGVRSFLTWSRSHADACSNGPWTTLSSPCLVSAVAWQYSYISYNVVYHATRGNQEVTYHTAVTATKVNLVDGWIRAK